MRQHPDQFTIIPQSTHVSKYSFFIGSRATIGPPSALLVLALDIVILTLEQAGIDLPEIPGDIQPRQLRVPQPAIILHRIGAIGILILYPAAQDIVKARGKDKLPG